MPAICSRIPFWVLSQYCLSFRKAKDLIPANFKTQRLALATLILDHAAFIHQLLNTPGWLEFIGDRNVRSEAEAYTYINKINENPAVNYWTVCLPDEPAPIGVISLIQRDYLDFPDIGFAFLPEFGGNGYAFEAASAILDHLRGESHYPRLYAVTLPGNTASIRLLVKLGFHFQRPETFEHQEKLLYRLDMGQSVG